MQRKSPVPEHLASSRTLFQPVSHIEHAKAARAELPSTRSPGLIQKSSLSINKHTSRRRYQKRCLGQLSACPVPKQLAVGKRPPTNGLQNERAGNHLAFFVFGETAPIAHGISHRIQ
ncbi:hypothetical protein I7I51_07029 [Histoplasma capsulatum]|uniref:Uncharacterized protein n=1 Tax=Ajellomyces capsulatus TaxID=5037 RepID=A0A8A1MI62_AJECA|nr:hypothetical protein I7I51_07029 [Histoplasma capsulatum]